MRILEAVRSWLQGRGSATRVETLPDRVWISTGAKLNGIRRELAHLSTSPRSMVALVAHFPDVLKELESLAGDHMGAASVRALPAQTLSADVAGQLPLGEWDTLELWVAERHPLASRDEEVASFAQALPCRCRLVYHLSIDDPLLAYAGSDSLRTVLEQVGMTEEEPITHTLIARSIQQAQRQIEAKATEPRIEADSAAEWLEKNLRA